MKYLAFSIIIIFSFSSVFAQYRFVLDQEIEIIHDQNNLDLAWTGALNAPQFNTMDLNADQLADLVILERTSNKLLTFINIDNQVYQYQPEYEYFFPTDVRDFLLLKDYDCDGKKDIFTNTTFGIKVYQNTTSGSNLTWELKADPIYTLGFSGEFNLQVNGTDIPAIADIDGDGDLDILVYNFSIGGYIRYHKNLSMENHGNCEFLEFERVSTEWGHFEECECDYFAFSGNTCEQLLGGRIKHAGGKSMLLIDQDGDGDKDLVMSQEDCSKLYFLENQGTTEDALMLDYSMEYPNNQNPAHFYLFPAAFYEDVDFDGEKDLLVAPNVSENIGQRVDFATSSWMYKNTGTNANPAFNYVSNRFLQEDMVDVGEKAYPLAIDMDSDGDFDLLLSGNQQLINGRYFGSIAYFENTGSKTEPQFRYQENDFLSISGLGLINLHLNLIDINSDNKKDLIVSGSIPFSFDAETYVFENQASNVGQFEFSFNQRILLETPFRPGDHPYFYDVNFDNQPDLLLGKPTGSLAYYGNSPGSNNNFELIDENFADIPDNYLKRNVVPAIADLDANGVSELITIDDSGVLSVYQDFLNSSLSTDSIFTQVLNNSNSLDDSEFISSRFGSGNTIAVANFFDTRFPSILLGTTAGGLNFLKNVSSEEEERERLVLKVYPNPAAENDILNVEVSRNSQIELINLMGQVLFNVTGSSDTPVSIRTDLFATGVYIVRAKSGDRVKTEKILISR